MELNSEKLTILLEHMLHHNKHHSEEIGDIAEMVGAFLFVIRAGPLPDRRRRLRE